ncbi:hypothetical protein IAU59_003070 [Kwoniella sp. CBS 9459]
MSATQNPISPDPAVGAPSSDDDRRVFRQGDEKDLYPPPTIVDDDNRGRRGSDRSGSTQIPSQSPVRFGVGSTDKPKKRGKGLTDGDADVPDIPDNNLALVMPAIGLVLFLSALDQTIVATALPTIAEDLHSTPSQYSWVGTSYLLASTLQTPINGRVSDIVGRKPMLYVAIIVFTVFSALCGAAKSSTWLIIARAFQGLGGGSIIGLTSIIVSDIVPLHKRGTYQGLLGSVWGIASVLGPILGGLLTEHASWRWCFYINLPTCGIAFAFLVFTLHLNPRRKLTFAELRQTFDFLGLALIMASSAMIIVGFSHAADYGFDKPASYGVIIGGAVTFLLAVANFLTTKRNAIIPARLFRNRTTAFFLLGSTLHAAAFLSFNYLLPEMLQGLLGDTPLDSGVHLLPFACLVSWMTVVAGLVNSKLRIVRPVPWVGYSIAAIGFGLFYKYFTSTVTLATLEGLLALAGIGCGLSLQTPMLVIQSAMPLKDMAASTSAWSLTRTMGGSIGLPIFSAILNTGLRSRFSSLEGYGTLFTVPESASDYKKLHELPDGSIKDGVMAAFADSFGICWIVACAFFLLALVVTLPTRSYSLNRARGDAARELENGTNTNAEQDLEAEGAGAVAGQGALAEQGESALGTGAAPEHLGVTNGDENEKGRRLDAPPSSASDLSERTAADPFVGDAGLEARGSLRNKEKGSLL